MGGTYTLIRLSRYRIHEFLHIVLDYEPAAIFVDITVEHFRQLEWCGLTKGHNDDISLPYSSYFRVFSLITDANS